MRATSPRVALVTGASRGIGYEICRQLADRGVRIVLTARTSADGREAAARLARGGGDVRFEQLDVADPASVEPARPAPSRQPPSGRHPGQQRGPVHDHAAAEH